MNSNFQGSESRPGHHANCVAQGRQAELHVAAALEARGWKLLKHDWRTPYAQVDLLLLHPEGFLVLVEVKARAACSWLRGEDLLSPTQRSRLERCLCWLGSRRKKWPGPLRLDLAVVELEGGRPCSWELIEELAFFQGEP